MAWAKVGRFVWWAVLVAALGFFLLSRGYAIASSNATGFDIAALLLLAALLLTPLFREVTIWGVSLKRELDRVERDLSGKIAELKLEVTSAIDIRHHIQQSVYLSPVPTDALLPQLRSEIETAVRRLLEDRPIPATPEASNQPLASGALELFSVRYAIDEQVRRISKGRGLFDRAPGIEGRRSTMALIGVLSRVELIPTELAAGLRDVYAICSKAIHAEEVTPAQSDFVRDLAPQLIAALRRVA